MLINEILAKIYFEISLISIVRANVDPALE